ncbi:vacuolar ATPase assembly integral membrane protein VMA21 homolog isoform X2 [Folsomia candida]|uniref:vacuolar ATPase assembly integral membrane protein VMA21 homolog isoform X2 n=1 Tax=Folsomia candida TaxID=158441 RepID=UPI0016055443|nr:vacuolar ATPase assembly integral membrane protein VMA21 homolog isoform X2 [Folsomia candida]XP_035704699.1 vacuolar ATPase assembly integral membrane protein VMA21 homolog isoform X2 [Folsomia candida]
MYNLDGQAIKNSTSSKPAKSEFQIFKQVLFHCFLIILCPITVFFLLKIYFFDGFLELESLQSNLYSAFAAVIVLHLALGNFIYHAYFDTETIPGFDKLDKED